MSPRKQRCVGAFTRVSYADSMTPSPVPIDVILHSGPASGWEILGTLGPLAVLLAALVAAVVGLISLKQRTTADALSLKQKHESDAKALAQKRLADDRSEWWRRVQWALDRALDGDPDTKALGMATLEVLANSKLAHAEELELFDIVWEAVSAIATSSATADNDANAPLEFLYLAPEETGSRGLRGDSGSRKPRPKIHKWSKRPLSSSVDSGQGARDNGDSDKMEEG